MYQISAGKSPKSGFGGDLPNKMLSFSENKEKQMETESQQI